MKYYSTRDTNKIGIPASLAIVNGLAPDGGLYVPSEFPIIKNYIGKPYQQLAFEILRAYLTDFSDEELKESIKLAYGQNDEFLPVRLNYQVPKTPMVELFHGRTAAFKDVALQLFPHLLRASLEKNGETRETVILTATSGDTGSAVLAGIANVPKIRAMVFFPANGVSNIQKLQMTTQQGTNLHVFGITGNFDDAQSAVKEVFADKKFQEQFADKYLFTSANSINLGRLLPQIVYYFYSYSKLVENGNIKDGDKVNFVVPTGNFGNILAGYYASKMGLPINKLICAANANNVLCDFIKTGVYDKNRAFKTTLSPSMDILISSNLERFIYAISSAQTVIRAYTTLKNTGKFSIQTAFDIWDTDLATDAETLATIKLVYENENYIMDPHTAVAKCVYEKYKTRTGDKTYSLILSTASPHKFPEAIEKAIGPVLKKPPASLHNLGIKPVLHNAIISDIKKAVCDTLRTIKVPATSANLGCGFDSVGFAVNLYLEIEIVEPSAKWEILHDLGAEIPKDETNLIITTALGVAPDLAPHKLRMKSGIPLSGGLGSSSSAIVAGIELACVLGNKNLSMQEKLDIACATEGHPDNVAPAILGGLVIGTYHNNKLEYVKANMPDVGIIAYVPDYRMSTAEMRNILPKVLSYTDAVAASGISNVMIASLMKGDMAKAGRLIELDMFHEPYREKLVPELSKIRKIARKAGAYATYLSGAGPTIISIAPPEKVQAILKALPTEKNAKVINLKLHE